QYLLRTCYIPDPRDVEQAPTRVSSTTSDASHNPPGDGNTGDLQNLKPPWAVDCITMTNELVTTPDVVSSDHEDIFGHQIFVVPDQLPPLDDPNARLGATNKLATFLVFCVYFLLRRIRQDPVALDGPRFLANVGWVKVMVDGNVLRQYDITKRFWRIYEDCDSPPDSWVIDAAERRLSLGMGRRDRADQDQNDGPASA
ncbi:hypothetical protein IMZ48_31880, partial [Candidatus Bathyarchaeota archaeon]|nr:hypothetical protein [Candidatus Bathyarchaeota archaeon]